MLTALKLPRTLRALTGKLHQLLTEALDAEVFAFSDTRPSSSFLQHCTLVLPEEGPGEADLPHKVDTLSSRYRGTIAVVDRGADIDQAAAAVVRARFSRAGGSPYAPEIVLVNEFIMDKFTSCLLKHLSDQPTDGGDVRNLPLNATQQKPHRQNRQDGLDIAGKSDGVEVIFRGSKGSIVEVQDR